MKAEGDKPAPSDSENSEAPEAETMRVFNAAEPSDRGDSGRLGQQVVDCRSLLGRAIDKREGDSYLAELLLERRATADGFDPLWDSVKSNVDHKVLWPSPVIPVCWENPEPQHAASRELVREAIAATWEAASERLRFTGWDQCGFAGTGIRIFVVDDADGARANRVGKMLDDEPKGIVLNFTFQNWNPRFCAGTEDCIRVTAVHEFGHALGLMHEQNRPDAPKSCEKEVQGGQGTCVFCPFDEGSIMNYCKPAWRGGAQLSWCDKRAIRELYDRPRPEVDWPGKLDDNLK